LCHETSFQPGQGRDRQGVMSLTKVIRHYEEDIGGSWAGVGGVGVGNGLVGAREAGEGGDDQEGGGGGVEQVPQGSDRPGEEQPEPGEESLHPAGRFTCRSSGSRGATGSSAWRHTTFHQREPGRRHQATGSKETGGRNCDVLCTLVFDLFCFAKTVYILIRHLCPRLINLFLK
jgi:hypothetical protein